jgi:Zn-dependent protease
MSDVAVKKSSSAFEQINRFIVILPKLAKFAKLAKAAKLLKVAISSATLALSVFCYGSAYGSWVIGFGLCGLLLVHELGHVFYAKRAGIKASLPIFIPFVGAAIFVPKFDSVRKEALVAAGGPLFGLASSIAMMLPYAITGERAWLGLAVMGAVLNLFNLIPLKPLDGGRMTIILGPAARIVGFTMLALLSIAVRKPWMLYIWVLVAPDIPFRTGWRAPAALIATAAMVGLIAFGFSDQPYWIDTIESMFAVFITFVYFSDDHQVRQGKKSVFAEEFNDDHTIGARERIRWLAIWLGLIVALAAVALGATYLLGGTS